MIIRSLVGFEADFPTDGRPERPEGRELAEFLAERLRAAGLPFADPVDRENWAWDLMARIGRVDLECLVAFTDDGPRQWQVHTYPRWDFPRRLLRRYQEARDAALLQSVHALHAAISADARFKKIRWYDPEEFERDERIWAPSP